MAIRFTINGEAHEFDGDANMPLLWYLREDAGLKGTKYGCGIAQCGACTVHMGERSARSCSVPMSAVENVSVTTIEGLGSVDDLSPVQRAWIELDVAQCGYCQAGQIMAVTTFLERFPQPTDEDINREISNICRCGSYYRIRKAIHRAAELKHSG
ncbi:MAG: (2Fe-2S)-binding protein [Pseudomonadota bacterium]